MKRIFRFCLTIPFLLVTATSFASNSPTNSAPTSINLATSTYLTLLSLSGSGVLHSISCKVTTAVTGFPTLAWWTNVDGGGNVYFDDVYSSFSTFTTPFYYMSNSNNSSTAGSAVGDGFTFVINKPYSSSLTVSVLASGASTGVLSCITTYN